MLIVIIFAVIRLIFIVTLGSIVVALATVLVVGEIKKRDLRFFLGNWKLELHLDL